ncbi:MAG: hypothetical protein HYY13_09860 [Nitrospirae bacterium]|nr:hypothetical protein [Nitrospirota bacterium]
MKKMLWLAAATAAAGCTDTYGPPDVQLEADSVQVSDVTADDVGGGAIALYDGWVYPVAITAYREVESAERSVNPVPVTNRRGQIIQVLPGILVQFYLEYFFVADCTLYPQDASLSKEEYWQVLQVGVDPSDCAVQLPADQVSLLKPDSSKTTQDVTCLLSGLSPADNGKPFLGRTGPNGQIHLLLRLTDPDPTSTLQSFFVKMLAMAGDSSVAFQGPSDASTVCGTQTL